MTRGLVDRLSRLAAGAEPPPLDDTGARRLIERALVDARRPTRSVDARRAPMWPLATAAVACAIAIAVLAWPRAQVHSAPELLHVTLPTGDRLVGEAGARFDIEALAPAARRLRLREGTMLFDVAHVVPGQRFEVATDNVTVIAKGTVFSVTTDAATTRVHVYEGAVDVVEAGQAHAVAVGQTWAAGRAAQETTAIAVEAEQAVVTRALKPSPPPTTRRDGDQEPGVIAKTPEEPRAPEEPKIRRAERAESRPPVAASPSAWRLGVNSSLGDARAAIATGEYARALAILDHIVLDGAGYLLLADALRGLHRTAEAADALDQASRALTGAARAEAAYSSAYLRFHDLADADGALASIDAADVDAIGSPFGERGLALRAQILVSLHRDADAKEAATHYLERYPHGDLARYMQSVTKK